MRDAFGVAHVHDIPNDVVRVFLQRIVGRAVEIAAGPVIVHAQSTADIEITKFVSELAEFCIVSRRFPNRAFDRRDVGNLRTDVKMNQLQAIGEAGIL